MFTRWQGWLMAWVQLAESVAHIVSLGFVNPSWSWKALHYFTMQGIKERAERRDIAKTIKERKGADRTKDIDLDKFLEGK